MLYTADLADDEALAKHAAVVARHLNNIWETRFRFLTEALQDSWSDLGEFNASEIGSTTLELDIIPQTEQEARIDYILAYAGVAAGNGGLIELGTRNRIVVPAGQIFAVDTRIRLNNTEQRRITSVTLAANIPGAARSGPAGWFYLGLFGKVIPPGALRW